MVLIGCIFTEVITQYSVYQPGTVWGINIDHITKLLNSNVTFASDLDDLQKKSSILIKVRCPQNFPQNLPQNGSNPVRSLGGPEGPN